MFAIKLILSLILVLIQSEKYIYGSIEPMKYLAKYGYLGPTARTAADYREALKTFQMVYSLPVTGEFDLKTRQFMSGRRCGNKDPVNRFKNQIKNRQWWDGYTLMGSKWTNYKLTYWIRKDSWSEKLDKDKTLIEIKEAFKQYSDVTPLRFIQKEPGGDIKKVHFDIVFARRLHCCHPGGIPDRSKFDGNGGDLAHAAPPSNGGDIHFDDDDNFELDHTSKNRSRHALGLEHDLTIGSIMNAYERGWLEPVLDKGTIAGVRVLYGNESIKLP